MRSTLPPGESPEPALLVEPIIAWRAWALRRDLVTERLVLGSIAKPASWPPMRALHATCRAGGEHRSPDPGCTCGIYGLSSARRLRRLARGARGGAGCLVVGSVAMWGRVIEHESGFRAEYAYPDRVRLACSRCLREGSMRQADVVVRAKNLFGEELEAALCERHAGGVPGRHGAAPAKPIQVELLSTYAVDLLVDPEPPRRRLGGVLVADHHPGVRAGLVRYLGLAGFRVVGVAEDGTEAVELVERLRPAVVTTCIRMPRDPMGRSRNACASDASGGSPTPSSRGGIRFGRMSGRGTRLHSARCSSLRSPSSSVTWIAPSLCSPRRWSLARSRVGTCSGGPSLSLYAPIGGWKSTEV